MVQRITQKPLVDKTDLPVLTNIVQSHHTLEELHVGKIKYHYTSTDPSTDLLQLIEAAGNSQLKELRLDKSDYDKLPSYIHEKYKHLVMQHDLRYISPLLLWFSVICVLHVLCYYTNPWTIIICFQKRFLQVASLFQINLYFTHSPIVRYAVLNYACIRPNQTFTIKLLKK